MADWQSAIICSAGTHFTDHEYVTQVPAQTEADGSTSSPATGVGYTYHCAGRHSLSGSRTPEVLAIQFIAGTLATYLLVLGLTARSALRRRAAESAPG